MGFIVQAIPARPVTKKSALIVSYIYAFLLVVISLCQLFTLDDFLKIFCTFNVAGGPWISGLIAAPLVVCQVMALPFLLRLDLSPAMWTTSWVCSLLVAIVWTALSLFLVLSRHDGGTGIFGSLAHINSGVTLLLSFIMLALASVCTLKLWRKN